MRLTGKLDPAELLGKKKQTAEQPAATWLIMKLILLAVPVCEFADRETGPPTRLFFHPCFLSGFTQGFG